jgi:serine protease inhibitor
MSMTLPAVWPFYESELVQVIDMPYKRKGRKYPPEVHYSALVVLPRVEYDIQEFIDEHVTPESLCEWMTSVTPQHGRIELPRFTLISEMAQPIQTMRDIGITDVFNRELSDLSGMTEGLAIKDKLYANKMVHKATLYTNESGSEASAATVISIGVTASNPMHKPKTFMMRVDRPFLFIIHCREQVAFIAKVVQPTALIAK